MVDYGLLKVYDNLYQKLNLGVTICHNKVSDWIVEITAYGNRDKPIVQTQSCDLSLALAEAEVEFKKWLNDNNGGY